MIQYPRTIRNFGAFVDGVGYAGRATEAKLPVVTMQTAAHRGSGMDAPLAVDMGMEALTAELTLAEWVPDLIGMWGTRQTMVLRPAAVGEDDFTATTIIATLGGRLSQNDFNTLKPGDDVPLKVMVQVDLFKLEIDGRELFDIDVRAGKRVIDGTDQQASIRQAMGF